MITIQNFYSTYQMHHFRAKATLLKKTLDNPSSFQAKEVSLSQAFGFTDEDVKRSLKIEMRSNLFHCIETFFTLYFCLQPDENGRVNDLGLFENLNKKKFYHEQIRQLAAGGIAGIDLNKNVLFSDQSTTFGKYLFYFSVKETAFKPGLEQCLQAIKKAMIGLATEFSDIAEYNSYKHALRSVPVFTDLYLVDPETMEQRLRIDASDSMTYLKDLTNTGYTFTTKMFDTLRDFKMTLLCSNLIYLIIAFRKLSINKKTDDRGQIAVAYLGEKEVEDCLQKNIEFDGFSQTLSTQE